MRFLPEGLCIVVLVSREVVPIRQADGTLADLRSLPTIIAYQR